MQPMLNPYYPKSTSIFEDDYILVKRVTPYDDWKSYKGQLMLVRDPTDPKVTHFRRLAAVEGEWHEVNENMRRYIEAGHAWFLSENPSELDKYNPVSYNQLPLALVEGRALKVIWPRDRKNARLED